MNPPLIQSARILAEGRMDGLDLAFLGEIESAGPVRYLFLLAAFEPGCDEPVAVVSSESRGATSAPCVGAHSLRLHLEGRHLLIGADTAWADQDTFLAAAVSILRDALDRVPG